VLPDLDNTFLELMRDNDARLWRICRAYARDVEAQKDLYQEMLVQLWRSLPSFAGDSLPGTWVYRVALNTALAHSRRVARRRESPLQGYDVPSEVPSADEVLGARQRVDRLYAAIDRLNDVDKLLVLLYLDEKTYHEIAEVSGLSETNVGVRLHRIKKELAGELAEEGV
jgi:RNA polymerase sigma-70 factor (ECF subfamily)